MVTEQQKLESVILLEVQLGRIAAALESIESILKAGQKPGPISEEQLRALGVKL